MEFILTVEGIVELIGSLPLLGGFFIIRRQYLTYRDRALLYLQMSWLSFTLLFILDAVSYMVRSEFLFRYKSIFMIILLLTLEIAVNSLEFDQINPYRFGIATALSALTLYGVTTASGVTQAYWPNGDFTYVSHGLYRLFFTFASWWAVLTYSSYAVKLVKNAPTALKDDAYRHLIGVIAFGPGSMIVFLFRLNLIVPSLQAVVIGFGVLFTALAIRNNPNLLYLLPFQAYKLVVIERDSGISLFKYQWVESEVEIADPLFSSSLESISLFVQHTMNRGRIEEIKLEDLSIMIRHYAEMRVYFVLLADKFSHSLKQGLEKFQKQFMARYSKYMDRQLSARDTGVFQEAAELIPSSFPYVPKVD